MVVIRAFDTVGLGLGDASLPPPEEQPPSASTAAANRARSGANPGRRARMRPPADADADAEVAADAVADLGVGFTLDVSPPAAASLGARYAGLCTFLVVCDNALFVRMRNSGSSTDGVEG
ncbi:hypothetical protein GCM10010388_73950 [Streptomyces mauvecolor]